MYAKLQPSEIKLAQVRSSDTKIETSDISVIMWHQESQMKSHLRRDEVNEVTNRVATYWNGVISSEIKGRQRLHPASVCTPQSYYPTLVGLIAI